MNKSGNNTNYKYVYSLNDEYLESKCIHSLDGYFGEESSARRNAEKDYVSLFKLIENLNIKTIFDCGCGSGSLLKYIISRKPLIPYGIDFNPIALDILKKEVLPEYQNNFELKNWHEQKIKVDQDLCIIMTSVLDIEYTTNLDLTTKFIAFRESKHNSESFPGFENYLNTFEAKKYLKLEKISQSPVLEEHTWHIYKIT